MSKRPRQPEHHDVFTMSTIRLENAEVSVDASINYDARAPQYAIHSETDDPVVVHVTGLTLNGTCISPTERAGHRYEVKVYGDNRPSSDVSAKLKDIQVRDKYGTPQYRAYRGRQIPVYREPFGLATLNKVRGESAWTAWIRVAPSLVTSMQILLGQQRPLYLAIHERTINRNRWVQSIGLQTTNPENE